MSYTQSPSGTLAARLGLPERESVLRRRLLALKAQAHPADMRPLEDWLLEIANARGVTIVVHARPAFAISDLPGLDALSNEELAAGICVLENVDRPQLIRLSAQLISRGGLDLERLCLHIREEHLEAVIGPMARAALRVEPAHPAWRTLSERFPQNPPRDETVIHWTRLADPIFAPRLPNAIGWRLVQ